MAKVAFVTGVGRRRGIGAGIAAGLAEDGWDLALGYWPGYDRRLGMEGSPDDPETIAAELRDKGVRAELFPADLEDPAQAEALVPQVVERLGPVGALVMAHCESVDSSLLDTTVESFDRHYAVNVRATWLLTASFVRQLPEAGGSVLALTSDHTAHNLPYGATKGALDRLVIAAAYELGDRGLTADVINPGPVDTGWMTDEIRASGVSMQPTGRLGIPADIANYVRFLVSDEGRWVNGQLLYCNGGFGHGPT